jgi:TonB family protein
MGKFALGLLFVLSLQRGTFEPARLESGPVEAIPFRTAAAGIVLAEVSVNERGGVTDVRILMDVEPFTEVIQKSVERWRFAPARDKGRMVASHVLVAGLFRPAMLMFPAPDIENEGPDPDPSNDAPMPTSVAVPPYPPNALGSAYVLIEVKLSRDGAHEDARVVSPKTGFDSAALDAARGWSFRPATRENEPVPANAYLLFLFRQPN